jgi:ribonuclease VapC
MNKRYVLDSSAILAVINSEPGYDVVEKIIAGSIVSSVNVSEVLTKLVERGIHIDDAFEEFSQLGMDALSFNQEHAKKTSELRTLTRHLGLSLGDRACLAVAIEENAIAVTADKSWASLNICPVEVIR